MRTLLFPVALAALTLPLGAQLADAHAGHAMPHASPAATQPSPDDRTLPAGAATVAARVSASPRHGEWVMIPRAGRDSMRAWVVYPERRDKAPVVVVIHEIYGASTWIRGVADQLAAEGYLAIAPDLVTGMVPLASPTDTVPAQAAVAAVRALKPADALGDIERAAEYAMKLPAALPRWGVVGFCWGGSMSFETAVRANPALRGAVVYYGTSPATASLASVKVPVLGLYGENDARVNVTIPAADSALKALGRRFEPVMFAGAGHGFLRQQDALNGANLAATKQAWPKTVAFFRDVLRR